jgi:methionyl-tRNA formyltransferase
VRILFLGTGDFALPSFEKLLATGHEVVALVTQPDRERGRGRQLAAPPTKSRAEARGLLVLQPRRIREDAAVATLRALRPEILVVVAYGQILPRAVLELAPLGAVNVHGSLLPRWRGAAPIQWAIAAGDTETGVTTMQLDEGLDTGPLLLARATPIGPEETAAELAPRLARLGGELLLETLRGLEAGTLEPKPQDPSRATLAPLLKKEDGRIDWSRPASEIAARVRGFYPWPGTFTHSEGRLLKVMRSRVEASASTGEGPPPGSVLAVDDRGILVACGRGSRLRLLEVQPESRRVMTAAAFAAGAHLGPGAHLG